jgi:3(or 17)beta-hydroxysteroid dehydrogenase
MERLAGNVALITGAASGIGRATAELFAREGARVVVADLDFAGAERVAQALIATGGECLALRLDVASEADWEATHHGILHRWSRLDVLVNCAGMSAASPLAETSLAEWRRLHAVNLDGVFLGTRAGLRAMGGRGGSIVNVASLSGLEVFPGAAAYSSSKAAVIHFSRCVAAECAAAQNGVRVNALAPGGVRTPMWAGVPVWAELAATDEAAAWRAVDPDSSFYAAGEVAMEVLNLATNPAANGQVRVLNRTGPP